MDRSRRLFLLKSSGIMLAFLPLAAVVCTGCNESVPASAGSDPDKLKAEQDAMREHMAGKKAGKPSNKRMP